MDWQRAPLCWWPCLLHCWPSLHTQHHRQWQHLWWWVKQSFLELLWWNGHLILSQHHLWTCFQVKNVSLTDKLVKNGIPFYFPRTIIFICNYISLKLCPLPSKMTIVHQDIDIKYWWDPNQVISGNGVPLTCTMKVTVSSSVTSWSESSRRKDGISRSPSFKVREASTSWEMYMQI